MRATQECLPEVLRPEQGSPGPLNALSLPFGLEPSNPKCEALNPKTPKRKGAYEGVGFRVGVSGLGFLDRV